MKFKCKLTFLLLFLNCYLFSLGAEFSKFMEKTLASDIEFQKKINSLNLVIAKNKIEKSINWFDINIKYQQHTNDMTRDQTEPLKTEFSNITEEDSRWSIELNKSFFQNDLDNVHELIKYRLDIIEIQQELLLYKMLRLNDLIDEYIKMFEAKNQIELLEMENDLLNRENQILEELYSKNIISTSDLIKNLESKEEIESSLSNWKEILEESTKYLPPFLDSFGNYIQTVSTEVDTLKYKHRNNDIVRSYEIQLNKVLSSIRRNSYYFFIPEINATVSYNERKTLQDWKITENSEAEFLRERDFTEKYPEFEVELSLPLNIFGNNSGKYKLLEALKRRTLLIKYEIEFSLNQSELKQLSSFKKALTKYHAITKLSQLYKREYNTINVKYKAQPTILGTTPEITLTKELVKKLKVDLKWKISEMELYKNVFLINYFKELK